MSKTNYSEYLSGLLNDNRQILENILKDAQTPHEIEKWIMCPTCKSTRKHSLKYQKYDLNKVMGFLKFCAEYGVGKPVEKKEVEVRRTVELKDLSSLTDDELMALIASDS